MAFISLYLLNIISPKKSILFRLVGEVTALDILHIVAYSLGDDGEEIGIATQETGAEVVGHAEHVAYHKYLSVDTAATPKSTNYAPLIAFSHP